MSEVNETWTGVSLFSGAGIGDLGLRAGGVEFIALAELDPPRADLARRNFPEARVFASDLQQEWGPICDFVEARLDDLGRGLDLLACTPPCQGMSKSGQGKLLRNIREGKRPRLDPRNRLILAGLDVIKRLQPRWVVFENVTEMQHTLIEDRSGEIRPILEIVAEELQGYAGWAHAVEFADYGIPQRRQRLITVLSREQHCHAAGSAAGGFVPAPSHSNRNDGLQMWVSVDEALASFPALDAASPESASSPNVPFHRVPVLDARKYAWISHTPPGASAFDNQCVNPSCRFDANPTHGNARVGGINQSKKDTPINCLKCSAPLPRPTTVLEDGSERLMSGYTSAYKRMRAELPAPAITRNLSYPCSDHKVHPTQNRVLSLAEAFVLQTLDRYPYTWEREPETGSRRAAADTLVRLVLGESVPPAILQTHVHLLQQLETGKEVAAAGGTPLADQKTPWSDQEQLALV